VAKSVPLLQPRLPGRRQLVRLCSAGVVGPTRTSETGEKAEGTTDAIIARRVAFMFSFTGLLSGVQAGRSSKKKFGGSVPDSYCYWFYYAAARDTAVRAAVGDEQRHSGHRVHLITHAEELRFRSGQVRFITRPKKPRTMRANLNLKRNKRSRASRTKVPK
jgi:hypothetical protein